MSDKGTAFWAEWLQRKALVNKYDKQHKHYFSGTFRPLAGQKG